MRLKKTIQTLTHISNSKTYCKIDRDESSFVKNSMIVWLKVAFNNSPNLPTLKRATINYSTHLSEVISPKWYRRDIKDGNNDVRNYSRLNVRKLRPAAILNSMYTCGRPISIRQLTSRSRRVLLLPESDFDRNVNSENVDHDFTAVTRTFD